MYVCGVCVCVCVGVCGCVCGCGCGCVSVCVCGCVGVGVWVCSLVWVWCVYVYIYTHIGIIGNVGSVPLGQLAKLREDVVTDPITNPSKTIFNQVKIRPIFFSSSFDASSLIDTPQK